METAQSNTSVEVNETAPAAPQQNEETIDSIIDSYTLEDLMSMSSEDYEEFREENHKGMKPLHEWMKNVPSDIRKHLANIRSDYTRKSQELAKARREIEDTKTKMQNQTEGILKGPLARQLETIDTEKEYDLFDPEGMKAEIQRQAQLMLKQMLQPAQEEIEVQQRRLALDKFKMENPEITSPEYRGPIVELLQSRPELKLEDAYYIVKAKIESVKTAAERNALAEKKARQKEVALLSSRGTKTAPQGVPQFKSAIEAYNYHKNKIAK